jgi:hypothetical protein
MFILGPPMAGVKRNWTDLWTRVRNGDGGVVNHQKMKVHGRWGRGAGQRCPGQTVHMGLMGLHPSVISTPVFHTPESNLHLLS